MDLVVERGAYKNRYVKNPVLLGKIVQEEESLKDWCRLLHEWPFFLKNELFETSLGMKL